MVLIVFDPPVMGIDYGNWGSGSVLLTSSLLYLFCLSSLYNASREIENLNLIDMGPME